MATKMSRKDVSTAVTVASKILGESEIRQWIAEKAYDLYLNRGQVPGHDMEDWLAAEQLVVDELKPKTKPKLRAVG